MTAPRSSRVPRDPNISTELRRFLDDLDRRIPRNNFSAIVAPAVTDDESKGYSVGSRWIDVAGDDEYVCVDVTEGAAIWKATT